MPQLHARRARLRASRLTLGVLLLATAARAAAAAVAAALRAAARRASAAARLSLLLPSQHERPLLILQGRRGALQGLQ